MIIDLPKEFQMQSSSVPRNLGAYIENGVLKLTRDMSFRKVMTSIAYELKGKTRCCYCNKIITEEKITIDHMYPQDFGGPTIPNNLLPSCKKCNNEKGNLNTSQYKAFLKAKKEGKEKEFMNDIKKYQDFIRKWQEFAIPREWFTNKEISNITLTFNLEDDYNDKRYKKIEKYYKTYGHFQKPIIIDKNNYLLDGFLNLMYAKNSGLKSVSVIKLENVEVVL